MKVCLVAGNSISVSPYVKTYMRILEEINVEYDVVSKEHISNVPYAKEKNEYIFYYSNANNLFTKVKRFFAYSHFVGKVLEQNKYDCIVFFGVLDSVFNLNNIIFKSKKYIIDIRDYEFYLNNKIISWIFEYIIKKSDTVIISSKKFKDWLPKKNDIYVMHNIGDLSNKKHESQCFNNENIVLGYIGCISYFNENKQLVDKIHSKNIKLLYAGMYPSSYNIKDYCIQNCFENVEFLGRFDNEKKFTIYNSVDIINAIYGNDSIVVTTAIPNKLYDCALYKIPIMVSRGTYLSEVVEKYGLGISVDVYQDDIEEEIKMYKNKFCRDQFEKNCDLFIEDVEIEQRTTINHIKELLKG